MEAFFSYERNFQSSQAIAFAAENWALVSAIVIIYLMAIQIGTAFMARREKAFDLKYLLAAWNGFLCIFSFIGMCKTVSQLVRKSPLQYFTSQQ